MFANAEADGLKIRTHSWRNYSTMKPIFSTENFSIQDVRRAHYAFSNSKNLLQGNNVISDSDLSEYRRYVQEWVERAS
jgi:hypothetical protein